MTTPSQDEFLQKLKESKAKYISNLPAKIAEMQLIWNHLNNDWRLDTLQKMQNLAHNLAGSGGTFGFPNISNKAKSLELSLNSLHRYGDLEPEDIHKQEIKELLIALQEVELETIKENENLPVHTNKENVIFIIDNDKDNSIAMSRQLMYYECKVKVINDLLSLEENLKNSSPLIIIIDYDFAETKLNKYNVIQMLRKEWILTCPIVYMSIRDDFESRMEAVKSNANAYFTKPVDISLLIERINILTNAAILEPYRILIVEDDVDLANYYALILEKGGMKVFVENKPELSLSKMQEVNPELVVMDLYMPNYTGIELIKVIRQHQALFTLPIVLLTSERDINLQFLAREVGVDDFLTKPIIPAHLYEAVLNRVQRSRYMNVSMSKDSLTGLFVHRKINEQVKMQINIAERYNRSFSYAIIDIDDFKKINDTYGHLIGDNVLIALSNLLKTDLRLGDFVGRYGGEEFVIIFSENGENNAIDSLERLREKFSELIHYAGNISFNVTFSAGIASYPKYNEEDTLMVAADNALYISKKTGKNKITMG